MPRPKQFDRSITISFDEELYKDAMEFVKSRGWSFSLLAREAIREYIKEFLERRENDLDK